MHEVTAGVNYLRSSYNIDDGSVLQGQGINFWNNIAYHYENVGGKVNYIFNHRYAATFGFAYSGSDNFSPGSRWKFYPALSAAWIISNEHFLANNKIVSSLKLRASAGKSGNGQTNTGRYLYQQYFTGTDNFLTGNSGYDYNGGLVSSYVPNPLITAEQSLKYNVGIDAKLYQKIDVTIDVFRDKHTGIVTQDNSFMGVFGSTPPYANVGKVTNQGVEASVAFADKIGRVGYFVQGMAAYNNNKIDYEAEIPPVFAYNGATGRSIGTPIGLIATGFYQTADFNADGSLKSGIATPGFGAVQAGDIRYKDLNGDGKIDQTDVTKIGESKLPKLIYSFSAGVNFSGFDLEVFFQGAAKRTVNLLDAPNQTIAFVNNGNAYSIAEGAWAYYPDQGIDTRASAKYPRLTTLSNTNNYRASTFWEKSGDFLRLRNVELGYSLPVSLLHRARITKLRVYVNAVNPITWSSLLKDYKMDPEVMSGFPALKSYNGGVSLSF